MLSAQRPRTYSFDVVPSSAVPCIDTWIHVPGGVSAFHEATSSVKAKAGVTTGEVQVPTSYVVVVPFPNGSV